MDESEREHYERLKKIEKENLSLRLAFEEWRMDQKVLLRCFYYSGFKRGGFYGILIGMLSSIFTILLLNWIN